MFYSLLNVTLASFSGGKLTIGVGPILFGIVYTAFDLTFITMKRTIKQIVLDAMNNTKRR
jgi:hypothetical protein